MPATVIHRRVAPPGATLGKALGPIHDRWLADIQAAVRPALLAAATRWDRWTAVRYLGDQFPARMRQERALVRMIPGMNRAELAEIEAGYDALERLRARIDAAGRRRHTGGVVMVLLAKLLELLAAWCARIERAAAPVPLAALPAEAAELLAELEGRAA